jgi:hypothetical protein
MGENDWKRQRGNELPRQMYMQIRKSGGIRKSGSGGVQQLVGRVTRVLELIVLLLVTPCHLPPSEEDWAA